MLNVLYKIYSFVIAVGVWLGRQKIASVSLGVTFVLFIGIIAGHFGFQADPVMMKFIKDFGLILFIFSIGLQVGPTFFSSFKHDGKILNLYAVGIIFLRLCSAVEPRTIIVVLSFKSEKL